MRFGKSNPPIWLRVARGKSFTKSPNDTVLVAFATISESISVLWGLSHGQENQGVGYKAGKVIHPNSHSNSTCAVNRLIRTLRPVDSSTCGLCRSLGWHPLGPRDLTNWTDHQQPGKCTGPADHSGNHKSPQELASVLDNKTSNGRS